MKLKLHYANDIEDYNELLFHAAFQVLIDYVNNVKGQYRPNIKAIKTWEYGADGRAPHVFELAYSKANWFSRVFFRTRWAKHLAMSYLHHEINEVSGPDAQLPDLEYAHHLKMLMDLYLWYTTEYKSLSKREQYDIRDAKLAELMTIHQLFWDE